MQYRPSLSISGRETRLSGGAAVLICNGPVALVLPVLIFIERDWRYCSVLLIPRRICEDTGRLRLLRTAAPEGGTTNADAPRTGPIPTILLPEFDGCPPEAEPPLRFVLAKAAAIVSAGILIFSLYSRADRMVQTLPLHRGCWLECLLSAADAGCRNAGTQEKKARCCELRERRRRHR